MNKKAIQKRRIMGYFIAAAKQIIEKEGVESVTIRKVADIAGYNSATLYNYFQDLDHLLFFASMNYLKDYAFDLQNYIAGSKNALDRFISIWKCFCYHSYNSPKIYYTIFFDKYSDSLNDAVKAYYSMFPEELGKQSLDLMPMLLEKNIYARGLTLLEACAEEGIIKRNNLEQINEMILLVYQGMLLQVLNNQINYTIDDAVNKTIKYINQTIESFND